VINGSDRGKFSLRVDPLVRLYLGNSVARASISKGESLLVFGYASFERRNLVKRASYIKRLITPSVKPPATNNTHPGIMVSNGAYWQSRLDQCLFFAAQFRIFAQKKHAHSKGAIDGRNISDAAQEVQVVMWQSYQPKRSCVGCENRYNRTQELAQF